MVKRAGLALIELLVTLAVVAMVGWWHSYRHARSLEDEAQSLARAITQARARAAVEGTVTTVIGATCSPRPIVTLDALTSTTVSQPARGLQFTPAGLPRTCDGGGVGNTTILLEHRGRQAAVIVSSLGRVRWEMR